MPGGVASPVLAGPPKRSVAGRTPPQEGGAVLDSCNHAALLVAAKSFAYGDAVMREEPLLLVPPRDKQASFLRSAGTDGMIAAARQLGDVERLATVAAFWKLAEPDREALLAMGVGSHCGKIVAETKRVVGMFLQDFPNFASALDWELFARVVGTVSACSTLLPGGERAVYRLSDRAAHSCRPNSVVETLDNNGVREMRVIAYDGITRGEEITVNYMPEDILLLELGRRRAAIADSRQSLVCACPRCLQGEDAVPVLALLKQVSAVRRGAGEEELRAAVDALRQVDAVFPVGQVAKARARVKIAEACDEGAPEIGLPALEAMYEAALEEFEIVLGQKSAVMTNNIKVRLKRLRALPV